MSAATLQQGQPFITISKGSLQESRPSVPRAILGLIDRCLQTTKPAINTTQAYTQSLIHHTNVSFLQEFSQKRIKNSSHVHPPISCLPSRILTATDPWIENSSHTPASPSVTTRYTKIRQPHLLVGLSLATIVVITTGIVSFRLALLATGNTCWKLQPNWRARFGFLLDIFFLILMIACVDCLFFTTPS